MERIGVLVKAGTVQNVIVWGDESEAQYEADGWDYAVETTSLEIKPGIGWIYTEADGFRKPQPFPSWTYNGVDWVAPKPMPTDGGQYQWNETTQSWELIPSEE